MHRSVVKYCPESLYQTDTTTTEIFHNAWLPTTSDDMRMHACVCVCRCSYTVCAHMDGCWRDHCDTTWQLNTGVCVCVCGRAKSPECSVSNYRICCPLVILSHTRLPRLSVCLLYSATNSFNFNKKGGSILATGRRVCVWRQAKRPLYSISHAFTSTPTHIPITSQDIALTFRSFPGDSTRTLPLS